MTLQVSNPFIHYAAWAAYASVAAMVVSFAFLIAFFTIGQPFGTLNDIAIVVQVLTMFPLLWVLHTQVRAAGISWFGVVIGVVGILVAAIFQTLLVLGVVSYEASLPYYLAGGSAIGVWLILSNVLAWKESLLPVGLTVVGIITGAGYLLLVIGFWLGGQTSLLAIGGYLATIIGYCIWGIRLGRLWMGQ